MYQCNNCRRPFSDDDAVQNGFSCSPECGGRLKPADELVDEERVEAIRSIASGFRRMGELDAAKVFFDIAIGAQYSVHVEADDDNDQCEVLMDIAADYARHGYLDDARKMWHKALRNALEFKTRFDCEEWIARVTDAQVQAGATEAAVALVWSIYEEGWFSWNAEGYESYLALASKLLELGRPDAARSMIVHLLNGTGYEGANADLNVSFVWGYLGVAEYWAQHGDSAKTNETIEEAVAVATQLRTAVPLEHISKIRTMCSLRMYTAVESDRSDLSANSCYYDIAVKTADGIREAADRCNALLEVIDQPSTEQSQRKLLLYKAHEAARQIDDLGARLSGLCQVLLRWHATGAHSEKDNALHDALNSAVEVADPYSQFRCLLELADASAETGTSDDGDDALERAGKMLPLFGVDAKQSNSGFSVSGATALFQVAESTYLHNGPEAAIKIIDATTAPSERYELHLRCGTRLFKIGRHQEGLDALRKAVDYATENFESARRFELLMEVDEEYAKHRKPGADGRKTDVALGLPDILAKALSLALECSDAHDCCEKLQRVATCYGQYGELSSALEVLTEARRRVLPTTPCPERSHRLRVIAVAQIAYKDYDAAQTTLEEINDSDSRTIAEIELASVDGQGDLRSAVLRGLQEMLFRKTEST